MGKSFVTFSFKEKIGLFFNLNLLYLTFLLTLFGILTISKEELGYDPIFLVGVAIFLVLLVCKILERAERKEIEQKNNDESPNVEEEKKALDSQIPDLKEADNKRKSHRKLSNKRHKFTIALYILLGFYILLLIPILLFGVFLDPKLLEPALTLSLFSLNCTGMMFIVNLLIGIDTDIENQDIYNQFANQLDLKELAKEIAINLQNLSAQNNIAIGEITDTEEKKHHPKK
jgi:hypothetical protein